LKVSSLTLYVLPGLEVLLFVGSVYFLPVSLTATLVLLLLASFFLSLSLHVTYHEVAHRCKQWGEGTTRLMGLLLTILMGNSFHAYKIGHFNHHHYSNTIDDFTSTWKKQGDQYVPQNLLIYCLSWPKAILLFHAQAKKAHADGDADKAELFWSLVESSISIGFIIFLFYHNVTVGILYLALIYIGWALISLHNYGQHIPDEYGKFLATSFPARWYNRLLFNNGLHYEHHLHPGIPISGLESDAEAPLVRWPHFIAPFVSSRNYLIRQ
jgi:fatty acid desaturase